MKRFVLVLLSALVFIGCFTIPSAAYENIPVSFASTRSMILGDVDGDGTLNLSDAVDILRYLSHITPNDYISPAADYDQNGKVDLSDAVAILRVLAKLDAPKGDLMDNVKIETSVPSSAYDRRSGVTYPTAEHRFYHSNTTGLDRGVNVLLPANYDSSKKYPVLYMLHGIFGNEGTLLGDSDMNIACIYTNLVKDGLAKDMIIVFPNMYASSDPNQQPAFDPQAVLPYDNFINDLVNDLMPFIKENYPVLTDRDNTAIAGFSMGGREALFIGFKRPDLFAYCGAFAPAPGLTPMRDWAMEHVGQLSEDELTFEGKGYSPSLLMICGGTVDEVVGDTYKKYDAIMTRNGVKHICYDIPGANHGGSVKTGFYNFIRYIF